MSRSLISQDYELVEEAAAKGKGLHSIAKELGIRWATFCDLRKTDERLGEAVATGRGKEHDALVGRLFEIATRSKGKEAVTACIFLLKARHGYREGEPLEGGSQVNVQIVLPASLTEDDYRRKLATAHPEPLADIEAEVVE